MSCSEELFRHVGIVTYIMDMVRSPLGIARMLILVDTDVMCQAVEGRADRLGKADPLRAPECVAHILGLLRSPSASLETLLKIVEPGVLSEAEALRVERAAEGCVEQEQIEARHRGFLVQDRTALWKDILHIAARALLRKLGKGDLEQCCICLSEYQSCLEICHLPCKHLFHKACLERWLESRASCPLCRARVQQISPYALHHQLDY